MNARDNTPLRTLIADYLAAGEDTAAGIAKAIGKGDTPSMVIKELNAMRTDGQVECEQRGEQRGKKKELVYWLAVPLAVAADDYEPEPPPAPATISEVMLPPGVRHGTRAAQIYRVLPLYGAEPIDARAIATATGCAKGLIAPVLTAMDKARQLTRIPAGIEGGGYGYTRLPPAGSDSEGGETDITAAKDVPPPQYDPDEVAFKAPADQDERPATVHARLADAEQRALVTAEMLAERDRTIAALQDVIIAASETLAPCVPGDIDTSDMDLQEIAERVVAGHRKSLRDASSLLSSVDRYTAAGYLVRAPKRKPRTLQAEDKAREAALGAIRAGAPRAEVFALVPVGKAVRGAEWRPS